MINVEMKNSLIRSVQYVNNITGTETMEIESHVDSRVDYNDSEKNCKCTFSLNVGNTGDIELIRITVNIEAVYSFSENDDKKDVHTKINEELFAQARGTVFALCGMVGLPPMSIPTINFEEVEPVVVDSNDGLVSDFL